jgi:hypothetical protein
MHFINITYKGSPTKPYKSLSLLVPLSLTHLSNIAKGNNFVNKSDGADRVVIVAASGWPGLLVFLVVILLLLSHLLLVVAASRWPGMLVFLIIVVLLLGRLLLGRLLPQEWDKPCIQGFVVAKIHTSLVLQLLNPHF